MPRRSASNTLWFSTDSATVGLSRISSPIAVSTSRCCGGASKLLPSVRTSCMARSHPTRLKMK